MKDILTTSAAPAAIGPYSQGIAFGGLVFTSGQLPIDQSTGAMPEGIAAQTEQALRNVAAVLEAAGSSLANAVKVTVFVRDMNDFAAINEVYAKFFEQSPPARSLVEVSRLPKDASIEIECVAYRYMPKI